MPSRQERRKLERDAAKRAPVPQPPAEAGAARAAGAAAAAAALVNVNPLGDWSSQASEGAALFRALGAETVRQKAAAGDAEAQFSLGIRLVFETGTAAQGYLDSQHAEVGFARRVDQDPAQ